LIKLNAVGPDYKPYWLDSVSLKKVLWIC